MAKIIMLSDFNYNTYKKSKKLLDKILKTGCPVSMVGDIYASKPMSFNQFKKNILGITRKITDIGDDMKADKECRQLQIIADSLRKHLKIDEIEALTKGLDILEDLKQGGLIK